MEELKILVLCTGNSCRSQIAEAYLRLFAPAHYKIYSAGIETHGVNPVAIKIMTEVGIDISNHTSNHMEEYSHLSFDVILTVCDNAKENCPYLPSKAVSYHENFKDLANTVGSEVEILEEFRGVREQIKVYCQDLIHHISER